jgi:hypothetical protein
MEAGSFGDETLPPVKLDAAEHYPANKIKKRHLTNNTISNNLLVYVYN